MEKVNLRGSKLWAWAWTLCWPTAPGPLRDHGFARQLEKTRPTVNEEFAEK